MVGRFTKVALALGVTVVALSLSASCGGTSDSPPATNDIDGAVEGGPTATDAGSDAALEAEADAPVACDVGTEPAMPAITSSVVIEGVDGGSAAPAATGGDEKGLWVYTKITLYLPSQASGQIDPAESKIDGKGFIELDGAKFRQLTDTTTVLATSIVGKVTRAGSTKALGTYVKDAAIAKFTVACRQTTGENGALGDVGFSRVDATHGKLHLTTTSQIGTANLVVDLEKKE